MNGRILWVAAVSSLVLAGCQTPRGGDMAAALTGNPDCPSLPVSPIIRRDFCQPGGPACGISIQIIPDGSGGCKVAIGTDVMQMRKNPTGPFGDTWIFWWLAVSPAWEFRAEGTPFSAPPIFKDPTADTQFKPSQVSEGNRVAWIRNLNTNSTKYEYKIRVWKKGSNVSLESPDPVIWNDN